MMQYGTEKTTVTADDGSSVTTIAKYREGERERIIRHYRLRVRVRSSQDEMTEYIRFTEELSRCRQNNILTYDREDASTRPAFIIDYPKNDVDGSYFVIKNYCVIDIPSTL